MDRWPAEGLDEIRRLGVNMEICCKLLRFHHGGSGKGDLQFGLDEEFLRVPLSKKSIIQCDDRLPVSAGDADGLVGRRVRSCMKLYRKIGRAHV